MKEEKYASQDGTIGLWIEQGTSIHLKAVTAVNDPVELTEEEARQLASALLRYADLIS